MFTECGAQHQIFTQNVYVSLKLHFLKLTSNCVVLIYNNNIRIKQGKLELGLILSQACNFRISLLLWDKHMLVECRHVTCIEIFAQYSILIILQ